MLTCLPTTASAPCHPAHWPRRGSAEEASQSTGTVGTTVVEADTVTAGSAPCLTGPGSAGIRYLGARDEHAGQHLRYSTPEHAAPRADQPAPQPHLQPEPGLWGHQLESSVPSCKACPGASPACCGDALPAPLKSWDVPEVRACQWLYVPSQPVPSATGCVWPCHSGVGSCP